MFQNFKVETQMRAPTLVTATQRPLIYPMLVFKTDVLRLKNNAELREVLSQVVYNMRKQGRCYVKFENNQKCYHINVR